MGERVELHGDDLEDPPLSRRQAPSTLPWTVDEVPVAGSRPDRLTEVRPQERVLRRIVEQNVEPVRGVPVLDAPVPHMLDQAAEVVRFFVSFPVVAEQVIEVPTIILEDPHPAACAAPGSAAGGTVGGSADDSRLCSCSRGRANFGVAGSKGSS